jgi:hypothetical protein
MQYPVLICTYFLITALKILILSVFDTEGYGMKIDTQKDFEENTFLQLPLKQNCITTSSDTWKVFFFFFFKAIITSSDIQSSRSTSSKLRADEIHIPKIKKEMLQ